MKIAFFKSNWKATGRRTIEQGLIGAGVIKNSELLHLRTLSDDCENRSLVLVARLANAPDAIDPKRSHVLPERPGCFRVFHFSGRYTAGTKPSTNCLTF